MAIKYVHVKWKQSGADDMVPAHSARVLADAGDLQIVDPEPGPYRRFKPRVPLGEPPLGEPAQPRRSRTSKVTEPAPDGADQPEEASE
jgi:hypothetical protein